MLYCADVFIYLELIVIALISKDKIMYFFINITLPAFARFPLPRFTGRGGVDISVYASLLYCAISASVSAV